MEVLSANWYVLRDGTCIGIVKVNTGFEVKSYIGKGLGKDEDSDIQTIIKTGVPFYG